MCIQTDIWNCIASHRNKVKRTLSKCVLSKSNRWAVVNCNVMANSFDAVCIIRIYIFLMSTWARFCFAVLFFHDFQWIQKTKWNKYGRWPIENKKKTKSPQKCLLGAATGPSKWTFCEPWISKRMAPTTRYTKKHIIAHALRSVRKKNRRKNGNEPKKCINKKCVSVFLRSTKKKSECVYIFEFVRPLW